MRIFITVGLVTVAACGTDNGQIGVFSSVDAAVEAGRDAAVKDAARTPTPDARVDARVIDPDDAAVPFGSCELGSATSAATAQELDVLGNIVYYIDAQTLPAGRYRVEYTGGCFKVNFLFDWTVQAGPATDDGWWLVGENTDDRVLKLPGTGVVGSATPTGFSKFQDCVDANLALPPVEFDFAGGKLGVWLDDNPYLDNAVGEGGANPAWQLTLLKECPPDIVFL